MRRFFIVFFSSLLCFQIVGASVNESQLLMRLLGKHSDLYGRAQDANRLSSISVDGVQIQYGQRYDFLLWKKRPDQFRFRMTGPSGDVVCGFDGKNGWRRSVINGVVDLSDLSAGQLATVREEALFDGPLIDYGDKPYNTYSIVTAPDYEGVQTNTVEVLEFNGNKTHYTLGMGTGYILKRTRFGAEGDVSLETSYSDYRMVGGFPFAFLVENRVDGELVNRTEIENVVVNPGILSFYFKKPNS